MVSAKNQVSERFWTVLQVYLTPGNNPYIPGKFSISPWRSQRPEVPCSTPVRLLFDSGGGRNGVRTQTLAVEIFSK